MKKKGKLVLVLFFSIFFSSILTSAIGQATTYEYKCKAQIGEEFIYTVTELNLDWAISSGMEEQVGDKMKIQITNITDEEDCIIIDYNEWDFISEIESFSSIPDEIESVKLYKDPSHMFATVGIYVLTPVSDYLWAYAEKSFPCSSSGNVLTTIWEGSIDTEIKTFDSNGFLYKIEFKMGNTDLYTISRNDTDSSIPGYELPLIIGLTAILGVCIIYSMKKKLFK